jgi:glycosyltransferase involved in cell wall biosynthesis
MGVVLHSPGTATEHRPAEGLRVVVAARFDREKGHRYALEAVAHLKRAGFHVALTCVGDGHSRAAMEKYAGSLDVRDRLQFPGTRDHQQLLTELREHRWDVALLPSIETVGYREGIPVFLIEAMAAGIPVIATETGGIRELLEGGAGILIPQRDAIAIAAALERLATHVELRRRLGNAGMRRVRDQFMIESTVSALLDAIASGTHAGTLDAVASAGR